VAELAHFVGIVGNFGKFLWSFLSPPVAGLVHFVGIAGKAIASYAFTTEETGVEALLSEGSVKAL
jgi:hypothetical protein